MRRRFVIAVLVGIALAPLLSAGAAEPARMFHVGMVNLNLPRSAPFNVAFEQQLRELGYVEGQNLAIDFLGLDGHTERLPEAMEELIRRKVDVILAAGQEVVLKAAKQATGTLPIVMIAINYDPLAVGYVGSLARPGGNITEVFLRQPELTGKRLELLKQTVPDIARAIVFSDAYGAAQVDAATTAAQSLQLPIKSVELRDPPYDYARALEAAQPRPGDGLLFTTSIFFFRDRDHLAELALQHRLPSMFAQRENTEAGGLISYGTNVPGMFRLAADYVDRIFKGASPADLPVQQPTTFELVINLKTAKALGLTVPQTILGLATR
jgi:putative tryptophan/tyrosine transport system substrate-binding protein